MFIKKSDHVQWNCWKHKISQVNVWQGPWQQDFSPSECHFSKSRCFCKHRHSSHDLFLKEASMCIINSIFLCCPDLRVCILSFAQQQNHISGVWTIFNLSGNNNFVFQKWFCCHKHKPEKQVWHIYDDNTNKTNFNVLCKPEMTFQFLINPRQSDSSSKATTTISAFHVTLFSKHTQMDLLESLTCFPFSRCCKCSCAAHMLLLMATYQPLFQLCIALCLTHCLPLFSDRPSLAVCWTPGGEARKVIIKGMAMSARNHH